MTPWSHIVKDLGLFTDSTLDWRAQVSHVSQKVTGQLRKRYRLKNFLPSKMKLSSHSPWLILIDYGVVCYFDLNADFLINLTVLRRRSSLLTTFYLYSIFINMTVFTFRSQLQCLPIRQRHCQWTLTYLFSSLNFPSSPTHLEPYLRFLSSNH